MKYRYLLFVLATALFACEELVEKDLSEKTLEVISPVNNASSPVGDVTFLWREVNGARGYHITIVSPSFISANRVLADTIMYNDTVSNKRKYICTLDEGKYEWSIRALNSAYTTKKQIFSLDIYKEQETPDNDL